MQPSWYCAACCQISRGTSPADWIACRQSIDASSSLPCCIKPAAEYVISNGRSQERPDVSIKVRTSENTAPAAADSPWWRWAIPCVIMARMRSIGRSAGTAIVPVPEMAGRMPEQDQSFTQTIPSGRPNFLRDAEDLTPLGPATRAPVRPGQPEGEERGSRKDVGWHPLQPRAQGGNVIVFEKLTANILEQPDRVTPIATSHGMADGILEIAIGLKPFRGTPVQLLDFTFGRGLFQLFAQGVGEQVMKAIPRAIPHQRQDEQIVSFTATNHPVAIS